MKAKTKLTQPLKWHGGKHYLADRIISLMPEHVHYVEPFFGGGSVMLQKDPVGISEVANDVCGDLTNFWQVLQNPKSFSKMKRRLQVTPFSQGEWKRSGESLSRDSIDRACRFFIRCRQSRAGNLNSFAPVTRNRTRRAMNEQVSAWLGAIEGLDAVAERMIRVLILCEDATKVILSQDGPNTLFYMDPPYLHATRSTTDSYSFEMTEEDHERLLEACIHINGKALLSGYPSEMYDDLLVLQGGWDRVEFKIDNKASGKKSKPKATEVVWANFNLNKGS